MKVPNISFQNTKIPIFTNDIAKIVVKQLEKQVPYNEIKTMFSNPITMLAIDSETPKVLPSISETNNYKLLQTIRKRIQDEVDDIKRNIEQYHERLLKEDSKKERVLKQKRKIYGVDPEEFENRELFNTEINKKLCAIWSKKISNYNRHLETSIKKYKSLILNESDKELLKKDVIYTLLSEKGKNDDGYYQYHDQYFSSIDHACESLEFEILTPDELETYADIRLKKDLNENSNESILPKLYCARKEYRLEHRTGRDDPQCYHDYMGEHDAYDWLATDLWNEYSDFRHPIFYVTIKNKPSHTFITPYYNTTEYANFKNIEYNKTTFVPALKLLEQIRALKNKIFHYINLIDHPEDAILHFTKDSRSWGSTMQFPYWLKLDTDKVKQNDPNETFQLMMIKPGTSTINLDQMRIFSNDFDVSKRILHESNYNQSRSCDRLIVTIPRSLEYSEIQKLIEYSFSYSNKFNIICEDCDIATLTKEIIIEKLKNYPQFLNEENAHNHRIRATQEEANYINPPNYNPSIEWLSPSINGKIFINIDPDYYRTFFLDTPSNKTYWHRYDYSSDYPYHRKSIISFDGQIIFAINAFKENQLNSTVDMVKELILGSYSNTRRFETVEETYKDLLDTFDSKTLSELEETQKIRKVKTKKNTNY